MFCSFLLLSAALGFAQEVKISKIKVLPGSSISIFGDAKITTFTCLFDIEELEVEEMISFETEDSQYRFKDANLILRNKGFDCKKKGRNRDLHRMLKTRKYPKIRLTLKKAVLKTDSLASITVEIAIAGKKNTYTVPVELLGEEISHFRGRFRLNVRDFDLKPIKKMLGLIQVQDVIEIRFNLIIKYRKETTALENRNMKGNFSFFP